MEPFGIDVDGRQYIFDPNMPPNKGLQVIPKDQIKIPDFLYKYYSLSEYNLDAFRKNYIYASSRFEMNDDFDCLEQLIDMNDLPDRYIFKFYQGFHDDNSITANFDELKESFPINKAINYYGGFGIVSLTENLLSPTMWAHYANSNHGFAVKFNLQNFHERMLGPFPINYQPEWSPVRLIDVDERFALLYMTNIKSIDWSYEREWRYIGIRPFMSFPPYKVESQNVQNRKFNYSPNAIEEVIFGSRFFNRLIKKDSINNVIIAEPNIVEKYGAEKKELLEFLTDNRIKTSRIVQKEGSKTFELDTKPVVITRIDENSFSVLI